MKNLRLDLDHLSVESFDTTVPPSSFRGTVQGMHAAGTAHTDGWGLGCNTHSGLSDGGCAPTITCSQGLSPDNTACDVSCEVACPSDDQACYTYTCP